MLSSRRARKRQVEVIAATEVFWSIFRPFSKYSEFNERENNFAKIFATENAPEGELLARTRAKPLDR